MPPLAVHSLMPNGTVRCETTPAPHATTEERNVTCGKCLRMIETAKRAVEMQRIAPERWP